MLVISMKSKSKHNKQEAGLVELVGSLASLMKSLQNQKIFDKSMINDMMSTFTEILADNQTFRKMLADPKSDITVFEPIIKRMLKKKNGRHKS